MEIKLPIDMLLFCPSCGGQHIDAPEPTIGWTNPPHKSHQCHFCGTIWRPANIETNGVEAISETLRGVNDTWPSAENTLKLSRYELHTLERKKDTLYWVSRGDQTVATIYTREFANWIRRLCGGQSETG